MGRPKNWKAPSGDRHLHPVLSSVVFGDGVFVVEAGHERDAARARPGLRGLGDVDPRAEAQDEDDVPGRHLAPPQRPSPALDVADVAADVRA
jgi:hypothetical protein